MSGVRRLLTTRGRALAVLAVAVLLAASSGCETDDSVGGLQPSCITLIPVKDPTPGEVTSVWGSESTCDVVEVELEVSGVSDIWSVQFEVVYPDGIAQILSPNADDSFLSEGGVDLFGEFDEIVAGTAEIGLTRVGAANVGITPSTNNHLIRLRFLRLASSGSGPVTFQDATLSTKANPGDQPTEISVPFSGGEFFIEN